MTIEPRATVPTFAYIGSRTTRERNARGVGLSGYRYDAQHGTFEHIQTLSDLVNPSYLTINRAKTHLYSVHGDQSEVSSFAIGLDGTLTQLNQVSCEGKNPVHLMLSPDEQHLIVSNHLSSRVVSIRIDREGKLAGVCSKVMLSGEPGPHRKEQPFAKPHYNGFDPSGQFIIVPDKGVDRVFVMKFDASTGQLTLHSEAKAIEGAGPRHMAFHPSLPFAYVLNELDSTVTTYHWDLAAGVLSPLQRLSTQLDSCVGDSRSAAIQINKSGTAQYVSNRGHAGHDTDSIAVFQINQDGTLRLQQSVTACKTPRFITLSPDERFLFALAEDADLVMRFDVDGVTGMLANPQTVLQTGSPVCLVF